ncbi:MAG: SufE family protein [Bacteroidia bacterium]
MTIHETELEIIEEFALFDDWMQRYEHIIDLGKSLPLINAEFKTEDYIIKGCQSQVWLHATTHNNVMQFTADSDAIITKGLVALMIRVLNNKPANEVVNAPLTFINQIGLTEHLSPTRANGLLAMVKQMKLYALNNSTI